MMVQGERTVITGQWWGMENWGCLGEGLKRENQQGRESYTLVERQREELCLGDDGHKSGLC